jgi:hypothetical protein
MDDTLRKAKLANLIDSEGYETIEELMKAAPVLAGLM